MNHHRFIIHFLITGNSLLTFGLCANGTERSFHFEVELIDNIVKALVPDYVNQNNGPKLTENVEIRENLCVAAINHISFEFKDTNAPEGNPRHSTWLGRPKYADKKDEERKYYHFLCCETTPRIINIRPVADEAGNKFIIMVEGFAKGADGSYGMSQREYIFNPPVIVSYPDIHNADDELETDNLLLRIGNQDLRKVYEEMNFMDWMLVGLKAKDYILEKFPSTHPVTVRSSIGYRLLKFYSAQTDRDEDYVGYRCPIRPPLYTYLESPTSSVSVVLVKG